MNYFQTSDSSQGMPQRRSRQRTTILTVFLLLAASTFASCASSGGAANEDGDSGKNLSIRLNWTAGGQHAPLYYGIQEGFFEDEGISLAIEQGKGSQLAIDDVAAGNVDIAMAGTGPAILGMGQGRDIISIGMPIGAGTYGFFADKKLNLAGVKDLVGHEVLITPGSPETPLIPPVLELAGLGESDVKLVSADAAAKLNAYVSGQGDAMATTIPFYNAHVQAKRPSDSFLFSDFGLILPDYSYLVSTKDLESKSEMFAAFLRASIRSIDAAMADPEAAVQAVKDAVPAIDYDLELQSWKEFLPFICSESQEGELLGQHSESDWKSAVEALAEYADLDSSVKPTDLYTNQFFEADPVTDITCS